MNYKCLGEGSTSSHIILMRSKKTWDGVGGAVIKSMLKVGQDPGCHSQRSTIGISERGEYDDIAWNGVWCTVKRQNWDRPDVNGGQTQSRLWECSTLPGRLQQRLILGDIWMTRGKATCLGPCMTKGVHQNVMNSGRDIQRNSSCMSSQVWYYHEQETRKPLFLTWPGALHQLWHRMRSFNTMNMWVDPRLWRPRCCHQG
jgi:hypothetical protein